MQALKLYGPRTGRQNLYGAARIIRRTPRVPLAMPARASHGNLQRFSYPTGPMRDPQGCRTTPLRTRKGIDTARIGKNPTRASYLAVRGPYGSCTGSTWAVHGLFTISKPVRGPQAYNACIKTLRTPYGDAKFVRRHTGPTRTYDFCSKQPGNSSYGARECDVTGALPYGPRTGLDIVNSPRTARVGSVRRNTTPVRVFANYGCVISLTCP